jgi:hypothetical protein
MKQILLILLFVLNSMLIFAQTQKFDVMTFTPPKGWEAKTGDRKIEIYIRCKTYGRQKEV